MTFFTEQDREEIVDGLDNGRWKTEEFLDWLDQRALERILAQEQERYEQRERERTIADQMAGVKSGYHASCGEDTRLLGSGDWHSIHRLDNGETCWGYCDCTYAAPFPHSTGVHK